MRLEAKQQHPVAALSPFPSSTPGIGDGGPDLLISVKEAGRLLSRGRTFLRTLHLRGELVPVAIGAHRIGYYRNEVLAWLASRPRKVLGVPEIEPIAVPYPRAGGENGGDIPVYLGAENEKAA